MSRLKIKDMPPVEVVDGTEIIPTGGKGDVSVTVERIKNFVYAGTNFTTLASQLQTVDLRSQNNETDISSHINDLGNPHQVTKAQVGLGDVDNTSDLNKPISTATQAALTTLDNTKANTTYVDAGLNTKANMTYVDDNLALKEDKLTLGVSDLVATSSFENVKDTNNFVLDTTNQALLNRTEYLKTHNNLVGRDSPSSHPTSAILDSSGKTQQDINDYRKSKFIYPEDFGAVGDGVTNDSVAMQSALNAAATNKRILSFTHGKTYNCAGVTLAASCNIYGNGATLKGYLRVTGNDVTIRDFNLIGTNTAIALYLFGSTTVPTRYYGQKIHNVKITFDTGVATAGSFGLYASNIDDLEIKGCNIAYAIQLIGCTDYLIDGNVIDGNNYANDNELIHASLLSYGQIVNNTFKNSGSNFIDLYSSGAKTVVSNNRFLSCKDRLGTAIEIKVTMADDPANTSSDASGWAEQIVISNNYFYDIKAYAAQSTSFMNIYYIDTRAVPSFNIANTPRNFIITGNIFDGFDATLHGVSYFSAIRLDSVNSVLISNNIFRNLALGTSSDISSCIWVENCQDVIIDSNKMSIKDGTGVSLHGDCKNISISNNHILQDLNKSHTPKYGIRITKEGTRPDPIITFSKFIGNTIFCSISAFRQLRYAAGYMNDCVVSGNVFQEQTDFGKVNRCVISGNKFFVGATRFQAIGVGDAAEICSHNTIMNNQVESNTTTQKPGMVITRVRGSNISGNTIRNATHGMILGGTNVAGEIDYLNIKDNFSISQTQTNFPTLSNVAAADSATHQSVNNQKIT